MKTGFLKFLIGVTVFLLFAGISLIQDAVIKLPTADNTSSFKITDVNDVELFKVAGDGDITLNADDLNINANLTTLKLATNDNTSKLDITKNNGTSVLKVAGNGAIVGDGSGLSFVKSISNYIQGNQSVYFHEGMIPGLNLYEAQKMRELTISCPGPGIIIAQASGYCDWESKDEDLVRIWLYPHPTVSPTSSWETPDFHNLRIVSDYQCADSSDQYTSWSISKTYTVSSAQNYTVSVCADKPFTSSKVLIGDVVLQLMFFPTGGVGPSAKIVSTNDNAGNSNININTMDGANNAPRLETGNTISAEKEIEILTKELSELKERLAKLKESR